MPDEVQADMRSLSLIFSDATSASTLVAGMQQADFVLVPKYRYEHEQRELMLGRQVAIGVHALAGAIWLANPQNDKQLDATSIQGIGIRATYGLHTLFALEGEAALAWTGDASFNDTWQSMEGRLVRRATLGRVLIGGVARLGRRYIPTVRFGVGFQGASHHSGFVPTGGTMTDGPNVGFEAKGLWSVGLGFDARFGTHWSLGFKATSQFIGAETSSVEGGFHLGYGWNPKSQQRL